MVDAIRPWADFCPHTGNHSAHGTRASNAVALLWLSRIDVDTSYGALLPSFVLMGLGLGLVMSPMSTAAMNAVDRAKAGVAPGALSMSRMVGGTFASRDGGAGRLDRPRGARAPPPGAARRGARAPRRGPRSGAGTAEAPAAVVDAAREAYVQAIGTGMVVGAAAVIVAAVVAWRLVSARPAPAPRPRTPRRRRGWPPPP